MNGNHRMAMLCGVFALCLTLYVGTIAHGYNIGFDTLPGANSDPFVGFSEGGFSITPISGDWRVGQLFGDPRPSIFGVPPALATVRVTDTVTGLFSFDMVNLAGLSTPTATYTVEGFLNNNSVLMTGGTLNLAGVFFNIPSPDPNAVLDRLDISISGNTTSSFNVDNITVDRAIPEPATLALVALCSIGTWLARRSRHGF